MGHHVHLLYNQRKRVCTASDMECPAKPVHHVYMAKVRTRFKPPARYGTTFIRAWRKHRGISLERLSDRLGITHASLSRIERGLQPYNQPLLEGLAKHLNTDTASLLMRDPSDPEGIWSIWDQANTPTRAQIVRLARALRETGT